MSASNSTNNTIPAPWSWPPSSYWDGNDGLWNSFIVQVGTPAQLFRILPSTAGQETWVLNPQGCTKNDPTDCPYTRGAIGDNNVGFKSNESSSWQTQGIYELTKGEQTLGYYGNGLFGFDTVVLGNSSRALNLTQQVLASIADKSYYLGQFGLGPKTINFTTFNNPIPNYMTNLANSSLIPSLSFGYTAGAAYRNKAPASLTLGGYDSSRFSPSSLSFAMNADNSRPLQVAITKIVGDNTLAGTSNLLPTATYHFVDSTVPHIWLPSDAIQAFVSAFGLTYDNSTDLYLINDTMRSRMLQNNPTITFVISNSTRDGTAASQSIKLPYAAFDLQASHPFYNTATNYFPIRLARNTSQYTIGRTLLQESYLTADWERQNFSIAQTTFDKMDSPSLVPILSIAEAAAANQTASSSSNQNQAQTNAGLSAGAIAGIVVGVVVAVALVAFAIFMFVSRRRKRNRKTPMELPTDVKEDLGSDPQSDHNDGINEMYAHPEEQIAEAPGETVRHGKYGVQEVPGDTARHGKHGVQEVAGSLAGHEAGHGDSLPGVVPEAMGSDERMRYELPGSQPGTKSLR